MNNNNVVLNQNPQVLDNISLTPEQLEAARAGVIELQNLSNELNKSDLDRFVESSSESESSSFKDSFPNFDAESNLEVFKSTHELFEAMGGSQIVSQLVEQKGAINFITSFQLPQESVDVAELNSLINSSDCSPSDSVKKSLGDFTLREIGHTLEPFGKAVLNSIDSVGLGPKDIGSLFSILFMYHGLCKGSQKIIRSYAPSYANYSKLTIEEKKYWIKFG